MPAKLCQPNYFQSTLRVANSEVSGAIHLLEMGSNQTPPDSKNYRAPRNISKLEAEGLKWLKKKTSENVLSICEADKGGDPFSPTCLFRKQN